MEERQLSQSVPRVSYVRLFCLLQRLSCSQPCSDLLQGTEGNEKRLNFLVLTFKLKDFFLKKMNKNISIYFISPSFVSYNYNSTTRLIVFFFSSPFISSAKLENTFVNLWKKLVQIIMFSYFIYFDIATENDARII